MPHLIPSETAQVSKGPGQQKGRPSTFVYTVKNNRCCRAGCGKFSLRNRKCPDLFTFHLRHSCTPNPEGLKAAKASVELHQSAFLLMTSCLQLDCLLERAWGPGLEGCPPCHCHLTSQEGIQEPRVPWASTSDKTGTVPRSLTRNYSQLVQTHTKLVFAHFPCLLFMTVYHKTQTYHFCV